MTDGYTESLVPRSSVGRGLNHECRPSQGILSLEELSSDSFYVHFFFILFYFVFLQSILYFVSIHVIEEM